MSKGMKRKEMSQNKVASFILHYFNKVKNYDAEISILNWYYNQPKTAKIAFLSALIIGFISHLFVYTSRYFGDHDPGTYRRVLSTVQTGRWFNTIINRLAYGYVMPLVVGVFVTLFLSLAAFFICKIFNIKKKMSAVLISSLLTTFPSIAFTNLFLFDSANYHFGVFLAVFAVYVTIKHKLGFVLGAIVLMFTLAIYQSKFNIALALCIFYLINQLLDLNFSFKHTKSLILRFSLLVGLGGMLYTISLPISFHIYDSGFGGHRGFSPYYVRERLLSISGFMNALGRGYQEFFRSFSGYIYLVTNRLLYPYLVLVCLAIIIIFKMIIKYNIHKQLMRLILILGLLVTTPLVSNFAGVLAFSTYGPMIYPFVFTLVFLVVISERCTITLPIIRSALVVCVLFISANYIMINNAFYLKAFFFNERLTSISTRIADRIDPLLPLIESNPRQYIYFGTLPNEYLNSQVPILYGIRDDSPLRDHSFILFGNDSVWQRNMFSQNLRYLHGIDLRFLPDGFDHDQIREEVLASNMPVWPAESSVAIIDDVIVINFGIADIVVVEEEQYLWVRHWAEDHAQHSYEYDWKVYRNDSYFFSITTTVAKLPFHRQIAEDTYYIQVQIRNVSMDLSYLQTSIDLPFESE